MHSFQRKPEAANTYQKHLPPFPLQALEQQLGSLTFLRVFKPALPDASTAWPCVEGRQAALFSLCWPLLWLLQGSDARGTATRSVLLLLWVEIGFSLPAGGQCPAVVPCPCLSSLQEPSVKEAANASVTRTSILGLAPCSYTPWAAAPVPKRLLFAVPFCW